MQRLNDSSSILNTSMAGKTGALNMSGFKASLPNNDSSFLNDSFADLRFNHSPSTQLVIGLQMSENKLTNQQKQEAQAAPKVGTNIGFLGGDKIK